MYPWLSRSLSLSLNASSGSSQSTLSLSPAVHSHHRDLSLSPARSLSLSHRTVPPSYSWLSLCSRCIPFGLSLSRACCGYWFRAEIWTDVDAPRHREKARRGHDSLAPTRTLSTRLSSFRVFTAPEMYMSFCCIVFSFLSLDQNFYLPLRCRPNGWIFFLLIIRNMIIENFLFDSYTVLIKCRTRI